MYLFIFRRIINIINFIIFILIKLYYTYWLLEKKYLIIINLITIKLINVGVNLQSTNNALLILLFSLLFPLNKDNSKKQINKRSFHTKRLIFHSAH